MSKASQILKTNQSVESRADSFLESIKRNLQRTIIDTLQDKKDKLTDKLFTLSDFSLQTNHNSGIVAISRDEAEKRFSDIITTKYELRLVTLELDAKTAIFNEYFNTNDTEKNTGESNS